MQNSVPELINWQSESEETLSLYGDEVKTPWHLRCQCTLGTAHGGTRAVRVVQILHRGWDQHGNIAGDLPAQCRDVDQPTAGLLQI